MFFIVSNLDAGDDTVHKEVGTAVIMPCCHTCFKQLFFKEQLHLHPHIISFIDKPESLVSLVSGPRHRHTKQKLFHRLCLFVSSKNLSLFPFSATS